MEKYEKYRRLKRNIDEEHLRNQLRALCCIGGVNSTQLTKIVRDGKPTNKLGLVSCVLLGTERRKLRRADILPLKRGSSVSSAFDAHLVRVSSVAQIPDILLTWL